MKPMTNEEFRILIVDDNCNFRELLKKTLQWRFPTTAIDMAADGGEALRKVDTFLPNLIFMDIQLPGENGLTLTTKIKATRPDIIILIMTFYDTPEYRESAFQCGADRFLAKTSWNSSKLEELVDHYQRV